MSLVFHTDPKWWLYVQPHDLPFFNWWKWETEHDDKHYMYVSFQQDQHEVSTNFEHLVGLCLPAHSKHLGWAGTQLNSWKLCLLGLVLQALGCQGIACIIRIALWAEISCSQDLCSLAERFPTCSSNDEANYHSHWTKKRAKCFHRMYFGLSLGCNYIYCCCCVAVSIRLSCPIMV